MNWPTLIVAAVIGAVWIAIVVSMARRRKKGKGSCACGCAGCPGARFCHKE